MNDYPAEMTLGGEDEPERSSEAEPAPDDSVPDAQDTPRAIIELEVAAPDAWALDGAALQTCIEHAAAAALQVAQQDGVVVRRDGVPPLIEVLLTDDAAIRQLNAEWRSKDKATNVLSFPMPPEMPFIPDVPWPLGTLALAGGVMRREAQARGVALEEHLCWMIVHGILHLLGYDHLHDEEAAHMEALERRALARLGLADPYAEA